MATHTFRTSRTAYPAVPTRLDTHGQKFVRSFDTCPALSRAFSALSVMDRYFPDALKTLSEADPEIYGLVKAEEKRQWCASASIPHLNGV